MNNTATSVVENVDVASRAPLFDEAVNDGERWFTVILGDLLPEWGEGPTEKAAVKHLAESLWHLHDDLHDWADDKLAPHLRHQKAFLCTLARAFGPHA